MFSAVSIQNFLTKTYMISIDLSGKNALVCGSSDGIGKAIAIAYAQAGANVTLLARNEQKLQAVCDILPIIDDSSQKHDYLVGDFFQSMEVKSTVEGYMQANQKSFHILVNNGVIPYGHQGH